MEMDIKNRRITALLAIVVGILFITMKGKVVSIALALLGFSMIVMGLIDLIKTHKQPNNLQIAVGVIKMLLGAVVITSGWMFVSVALTVIAVVMLMFCVWNFITVVSHRDEFADAQKVSGYLKPIIGIIASVCLLFHQGGTVAWVFVVVGIIFVIEGVLILADSLRQ